MIGEFISHFKIIEKLGEGGMGVVYKAHDKKLDRTVALKFISPDSTPTEKDRKRFLQEARAAAKLSHPNICSIHSIDDHDGQQFIEMEYIEGQTLRQKMQELDSFELDTFRDYAIQITEALAAAHEKGVIHRDIKPENILVNNDGRIKIMDFGLAKLKGIQNYTKTGSTVGTLTYMSPEQIKSNSIDARSDLFSLGIVFYEMLTGVHPFDAEYEQALMFKILNEDPERPSSLCKDIPPELEDIIVRCLQKDREKRYHSANDIRLKLEGEKQGPIHQHDRASSITNWFRFSSAFSRFSQKNLISVVSIASFVLLVGILWLFPTLFIGEAKEKIPDDKHIAVLPFQNLNSQDTPEYLNDGIMEVLTSKITQLEIHKGSLWVVPSSEVRAEKVTSVKEATRKFGANLAVTGSLQRVEDQLLLTINLVDGSSMRQLRSSVLEMEWNNLTRLQDQAVHTLIDMLEVELDTNTVQSIMAGGTHSSSVYQQYIEGRGYLIRFEDAESIDKAIELFKQTVEADTGYVRGYAALAEAYWRKYELTHDTQWTEYAIKYGQEAINLSKGRIPEVYTTMALIHNGMNEPKKALEIMEELGEQEKISYQALLEQAKAYEGLGQPDKAEDLYRKAIDKKRKYWGGYHQLGLFYYNQGRYQEAAENFRKVTELAPDNVRGFSNLGSTYVELGRIDEALDRFHRSLEIRPNYRALMNLGIIYYYQKNYSEAIQKYEQALDLNDTDRRVWGSLGHAYYWSGEDSSKVRKAMEKAIELAEKELEVKPNSQSLLRDLAGYYLTIGSRDKSRELLQQLTSIEDLETNTRFSIINLYERLGERDSALHWMEKSLRQGDNIERLESIEGMDDLLDDPRVNELRQNFEKK